MSAVRKQYTKTEKAEAVGAALLSGQRKAAEQTGIPRQTLARWIDHPDFAELREKAREAVADQLWVGVQVGVLAVVDGLRGDAPLRDKAVALGILYDKHALLTGGATNRSESRDITESLSDAELIAAVREAERLTGSGGASPAPAPTPEG